MRTSQIIQSLVLLHSYGTGNLGDLVFSDGHRSTVIGSLPWERDGPPFLSPFSPPKQTQARQGGVGGVGMHSSYR